MVPLGSANTGGATGWCLEVHDLACAKLVAGREKDRDFVRVLLAEQMVQSVTLRERLTGLPLPVERIEALENLLTQLERYESRRD